MNHLVVLDMYLPLNTGSRELITLGEDTLPVDNRPFISRCSLFLLNVSMETTHTAW